MRPFLTPLPLLAVFAFFVRGGLAVDQPVYSWAKPHAKVTPAGDLQWEPLPFRFEPGTTVRYIDYLQGNDESPGTKDQPWKHHPWDERAAAKAAAEPEGPTTYVFKGGVGYRGKLMAKHSGQPGNPIRLTGDPGWGAGPALIFGSKRVEGTWKRASLAVAPRIPNPEKVWFIDLPADFDTDPKGNQFSALWKVEGDRVEMMQLARDPNWTIEDPNDPFTGWYRWDAFEGTGASGWLSDKRWTGKVKELFAGAAIWTQHRNLMGTPHRVAIQEFDPARGAFKISSPGGALYRTGGDPKKPFPLSGRVAYFIENAPEFLDAPGEYYADPEAAGGPRLYVRLADGADPNRLQFEVGVTRSPVEIRDRSHIEVSGLTFRFNDPTDGTYGYPWQVGTSPMVRIVGNCSHIAVRACAFHDVAAAVTAFPRPGGTGASAELRSRDIGPFADDVMDEIEVADCDVRNSQQMCAIWLAGDSQDADGGPWAVLKNVRILRNRVINSGFRSPHSPTDPLPAIRAVVPSTAEIAGNMVDSSWGAGVFVNGGKHSGSINEVPLARILVHHNKVENTMLGCNDYGALEIFQGGPAYFYNNISRNSVGSKTFTGNELAYNLYLDGAFKVYSFNNILAGRVDAANPAYYGHCGYFMVFGFLNNFWNNTLYRFDYGLNGSSGNRSAVLGNLFSDMHKTFIGQNRPGDVSMMGGGDTGEMGARGIATMSYGDNAFFGTPAGGRDGQGAFGFVGGISAEGSGGGAEVHSGNTLEELAGALAKMNARLSAVGVHSDKPLLRAPEKGDFTPLPGSAAIDRGVKFFAPWGLSRVVGEWHFLRSAANPTIIPGENFYMQDEHMRRDMYYFIPRHDLAVNAASPDDYTDGPLEDWIPGALKFDGKSRFARLAHAEMTRDMTYPVQVGTRGKLEKGGTTTYEGSRRKTLDMAENSFLIEIFFRTDPGHSGGVLAEKSDETAGYSLGVGAGGEATLTLKAGGQARVLSGPKINDGGWHHLIVEIDRPANKALFYLDGKAAGETAPGLPAEASLANRGDFLVGKGAGNAFFAGAIDFLRVSRGTLADARTDISELYAWQFDGPFLRDFAGARPAGRRDAGAIELPAKR